MKPSVGHFIDNSRTAPYRQEHLIGPSRKCAHCHRPCVTVQWAERMAVAQCEPPQTGPCPRSVVPVAAIPRQ